MGSLDDLIRDLKAFDDRKVVIKELRGELRRPVPTVRKAIEARAMDTLPKGGGLNRWVASARVTASFTTGARSAGVRLKAGRNSARKRSDIKRLDAGSLRHPSWGRRGKGNWHVETVRPGFFTEPASEAKEWATAVYKAIDKALDTIRKG